MRPRPALGLGLLLAIAVTNASAVEQRFDIDAGFRNDALRWNIAADPSGTATPNILSELTWEDVHIVQLRLGWQTTAPGLHARASAGYGLIYNGRNQDSDYGGDGRTFEFSRSNNDTNGDDVWDASAAAGYRFTAGDGPFYLTPLLGVSRHAQNLRITNGRQTIPDLGSFSGLNSTYQTDWSSRWLGIELEWQLAPDTRAFFRHEYHFNADYYAQADWNLRNNFAHPKSFEHRADGKGNVFAFGAYAPIGGNWSGTFSIDYLKWKTDPGTDQTYFSDGTTSATRLNEVEWKSWSINAGAELRF